MESGAVDIFLTNVPQWFWKLFWYGLPALLLIAVIWIVWLSHTSQEFSLGPIHRKKADPRVVELNRLATRQEELIFLAKLFARDLLASCCDSPHSLTIKDLMRVILEGIPLVMTTHTSYRCVILIPKGSDTFELHALLGVNYPQDFLTKMRYGPDTSIGRVFATGKRYYCPDRSKDPFLQGRPDEHDGSRSSVGLAIQAGDRILGVLYVDSPQVDGFTSDDIDHLEFLSLYLALLLYWNDISITGTLLAAPTGEDC